MKKIKEEKEVKDVVECTFKPVTNVYKFKAINPSIISHSKQSTTKSNTKIRKDRSPIDIDYDKQKNECTFKPYIYTKKKSPKAVTTTLTYQNSFSN